MTQSVIGGIGPDGKWRPAKAAEDGTLAVSGGTGGAGGTGDASAANQTTQIAAANLTNTRIGAVDEAAAASDAASSGLNGLVRRLLGRFGTLGQKAAAGSAPVVLSAEDKAALDLVGAKQPALALTRTVLLNAVTAVDSASYTDNNARSPSFHYSMAGTGSISATVQLQVRNVASGEWELAATTTLSGTNAASGAAVIPTGSRFMEYRVNLTAISGTSATLTAAAAS